jgi:hypothetical protein
VASLCPSLSAKEFHKDDRVRLPGRTTAFAYPDRVAWTEFNFVGASGPDKPVVIPRYHRARDNQAEVPPKHGHP